MVVAGRRVIWGVALAAVGALWWTRAARAQPRPVYAPEAAKTATRLSEDERQTRAFLRAAALIARMDGVEVAKQAQRDSQAALARSQNPGVLSYASDIVDARKEPDAQLLHLLHARGMAQPLMDNDDRKALLRLQKLQGGALDRAYMELAGTGPRREAVALYERAVAEIEEPQVKAWAERQLAWLKPLETAAQAVKVTPAPTPAPAAARKARGSEMRTAANHHR